MGKLDIDWTLVEPVYQYAAQDANGFIYLFENEPTLGNEVWWIEGGQCDVAHQECENPNWKETLTERHQGTSGTILALPVLRDEIRNSGNVSSHFRMYNEGIRACAKALEEQGFRVEFVKEN